MTEPENHTLAMLREMRTENQQFRAEVVGVMEHFKTVMKHLERSFGLLDALREDVAKMRTEFRSDLIHLENQNISRHGETMSQLRKIEELSQRVERVDKVMQSFKGRGRKMYFRGGVGVVVKTGPLTPIKK